MHQDEIRGKINEIIALYYDKELSADRAMLFISYLINHEEAENDKLRGNQADGHGRYGAYAV